MFDCEIHTVYWYYFVIGEKKENVSVLLLKIIMSNSRSVLLTVIRIQKAITCITREHTIVPE